MSFYASMVLGCLFLCGGIYTYGRHLMSYRSAKLLAYDLKPDSVLLVVGIKTGRHLFERLSTANYIHEHGRTYLADDRSKAAPAWVVEQIDDEITDMIMRRLVGKAEKRLGAGLGLEVNQQETPHA